MIEPASKCSWTRNNHQEKYGENTSETNQSARILIVDDTLQNIQIMGTGL